MVIAQRIQLEEVARRNAEGLGDSPDRLEARLVAPELDLLIGARAELGTLFDVHLAETAGDPKVSEVGAKARVEVPKRHALTMRATVVAANGEITVWSDR